MRKPDPLFEAMVYVCGYDADELTDSARGWVNAGLGELRQVGAEPDDLIRRARRYWHRFKRRPSPTALAKHWASLADQEPFTGAMPATGGRACEHLYEDADPDPEWGRYCVRCRQWSGIVQLRLIDGGQA